MFRSTRGNEILRRLQAHFLEKVGNSEKHNFRRHHSSHIHTAEIQFHTHAQRRNAAAKDRLTRASPTSTSSSKAQRRKSNEECDADDDEEKVETQQEARRNFPLARLIRQSIHIAAAYNHEIDWEIFTSFRDIFFMWNMILLCSPCAAEELSYRINGRQYAGKECGLGTRVEWSVWGQREKRKKNNWINYMELEMSRMSFSHAFIFRHNELNWTHTHDFYHRSTHWWRGSNSSRFGAVCGVCEPDGALWQPLITFIFHIC